MSSGILMSKEGRQGVILTKDGTFETVRLPKNQKVRIGEEIHVTTSRVLRIPKSALSALAACLLLFAAVGAFGLGNQNKAVAAYVSFDINPSFEAGLNRDLHIVSIHSMNKDGSKLLSQIKDYKNLTLDEFTSKVAKTLDKDGYFNQQPQVVVSVTLTQDSSNQNAKPLEAEITKALEPLNETPDFKSNNGVVQVIQTSMKTHEQAEKLGLTAGKYTLYKNAAKKSQAVTPDKAKGMTVKELLKVANPATPKAVLPPSQRDDTSSDQKWKKTGHQKAVQPNSKKKDHSIKKVNPQKNKTTKSPSNQKEKQAKKAVQNVEKQDEHSHGKDHGHKENQKSKAHKNFQTTTLNHGFQKKAVKQKDRGHEFQGKTLKQKDWGHEKGNRSAFILTTINWN